MSGARKVRNLPPGIRLRENAGGRTFEVKVKYPDEHGKLTVPRYRYADTLEKALIEKGEMLKERRRAPRRRKVQQRLTVGDGLALWTNEHVDLLEPSSREYYRIADAYRIAPYLYDFHLDELSRSDVLDWRRKLLKAPMLDERGKPLPRVDGEVVPAHSPRSINAAVATLKACYNWLIDDKEMELVNPASRIKKLHEPSRMIRVYQPVELERITDAVHQQRAKLQERTGRGARMKPERARLLAHRDATMILVLAFCGMRLGELLALQVKHYDDGRHYRHGEVVRDDGMGWLDVQQQVDAKTGKVKAYVKTKRARPVPVMPSVRDALERWLEMCPPASDESYLFPSLQPWNDPSRQGYQRQPRWRDNHFKPAAAAAGFPRAKPHEMRHTFVSLLLDAGVPIAQIAKWAGHSVEVMLRTYAHLIERTEYDKLKSVDAALFLPVTAGSANEGAGIAAAKT